MFTEGSKTHVAYCSESKFWSQLSPYTLVQQIELWTVIQALQDFPTEALILVAVSKYVVGL